MADCLARVGAGRPVLHVAQHFGLISETFVVDTLLELDSLGWRAWLATRHLHEGHPFAFPPGDRILLSSPPRLPSRIVDGLLLRRPGRRREVDWHTDAICPGPELVHAHFGWSAVDALPLARRLGLPLVATFHGSDVTVYPHIGRRQRVSPRMLGLRTKLDIVFKQLDAAIAVSAFIEGRLRRLGFTRPVEIIPAGVRLEQFPFRGALAPDRDEVRLLFVGRLVGRKGLDVLLRALPPVRAVEPRVRLDVVGDGPERADLDALAHKLGVSAIVRHHGAQPQPAVLGLMRRAHMMVMASRTMPTGEAEGSPVVSKEALAVGLPLVATNNGGTRETVPPEYRSELVPEEDPERLAHAIVRLIRTSETWQARAERGRMWVEQEFDWTRLAKRTTALYERTLADTERRAWNRKGTNGT